MLTFCRRFSRLAVKPKDVSRVYKMVDGTPREELTFQNVDVICNPNETLIDEFMKGYGKERLNFRREDIEMWKNSFKDNYSLIFLCLKNTYRITLTVHFTNFDPVAPHIDTRHQYSGFFWIHPDYRGRDSMKLTEYLVRDSLHRNNVVNPVAQCFPSSMNTWKILHGHNNYSHIQYVSYYKPDEMKIPENLNLDGIYIRNATEVPDEDIIKYDNTVFPYERSKFVLTLMRKPEGFGRVAYDSDGKVIGFGTVIIYPSGECVLAPLYADDKRVAQAIFRNILEQIPLDDKKLLRFHLRTVDKCDGGFEWIQPFVKCPIRKELSAYLTYVTHPPTINYKKTFVISPYTNSAV